MFNQIKSQPKEYGVKIKNGGSSFSIEFPSSLTHPVFPMIHDMKSRIKHLKDLAIDYQVISPWVDLFGYDLQETFLLNLSRLINDQNFLSVKEYPGKFSLLATLPLPYSKASSEELRYYVEEKGFDGCFIGTNINGTNLDSAVFDPLWSEAEKLDVPVYLHPSTLKFGNRLDKYYLENLIGNPLDTTIAASSIILGGVLQRHKHLKIILSHGGGYLPFGIGRIDHGYLVRPETSSTLENPPSSYISRFYYDSIVYRPSSLKLLLDVVSNKNIMLGTDYPFDMEPKDPSNVLIGNDANILRDVFYNNALSLFKNLKELVNVAEKGETS